ncbi:proton-conducting transporter transmembrane domain-containing protein [Solirubrobacter soli]|uniref:proton-conducting transporter transmembrane domain-containing protein n=1 Tax=Solirubrobacter soli TaxID=363832 RepID=UPI00069FEEB9|nr:proton-conducting transporter membrane subunit [Solirubrobacter soli]
MTELAAAVPLIALAGGLLTCLARTPAQADRLNSIAALATALAAFVLAALAIAGEERHTRWLEIDGASGVFVAVIAAVGLCSALVSPAYLRTSGRSWFTAARSRRAYYAALHAFWAALLFVPLAGNLALAWLVIEATTGASALLVSFSGSGRALEAGWKYLVLTTLGLAIALLGIVILAIGQGEHGLGALDWHALEQATLPRETALVALVLIVAGLATKIGWAPVHNWLPDAHSEAPAPISALLSAALLPTVALVAWRVKTALAPVAGPGAAGALFIGFGLASMIVAVPFLWRSLPWKRLLAYSSLEHMGVIALGIGFGTPLAIAGVLVHVAGHALAKALGFYAALPLLRADPEAASRPPTGRAGVPTATAMGVSLIALAALPPSPLFASELLIGLGGVDAGEPVVVAVAVLALALGFLGLLHALFEGVLTGTGERRRGDRSMLALTGVLGVGLLSLTAAAALLPGSAFMERLL